MKLEKRKNYRSPRLQWGLLPTTPTSEYFLKNIPTFLADDFHQPLTVLPKITSSSDIPHLSITMGQNFEGYTEEATHVFSKYTLFRHSSFIDFFEKNSIDIPKCFKSTRSLRRPTFELFLLRLVNYLMKKGKKEKMLVSTNLAFNSFFSLYKKNPSYTTNLHFTDWVFLHFAFNNISSAKNYWVNFFYNQYGNTLNQHFIKSGSKYHIHTSSLVAILNKLFSLVQPLFHFSLYSLDKRARKSGRKKSSKYIFIWKYVPLYRRKALLLKLIASDVKFNNGRTFQERLLNSLDTLYKNPQNSHVIQANRFAHQYVFKNLRRSLLSNFKMTA